MPGTINIPFLYIAGFDLSSIATPSQEQVMQAINQLAPKSNAGGIIIGDSNGGADWPNVTTYPFLKRCLWIDTDTTPPVLRMHDQTGGDTFAEWDSLGLATNSVTNTHIQDNTIQITKLAVGSGTAFQLYRINATGDDVEFVNPSGVMGNGDLALAALSISGAPGSLAYLTKDSSGAISWRVGTYSDLTGTPIISDGGLTLAKIDPTGASALQTLRRNSGNTATEWATPILSKESGEKVLATDFTGAAAFGVTVAHGLGTTPKFFKVFAKNLTTEYSYAVGDLVPIEALCDAATGNPCVSVRAGATNFVYSFTAPANVQIISETNGTVQNITKANWKPVAYGWA